MVEKIKTVIGCYFLLPDFRGSPSENQFYLAARFSHLKFESSILYDVIEILKVLIEIEKNEN